MKSTILLTVLLVFSAVAFADSSKDSDTTLSVPGVGLVRIRHEEVGEPISQPERVEVFVTCRGRKSPFRAAVYRMCTYQGHEYEAGTKMLTFKMLYGRVIPTTGDVVCDQFDMPRIDLARVCK